MRTVPRARDIIRRAVLAGAICAAGASALLSLATVAALRPAPASFLDVLSDSREVQILDRNGEPLNLTYRSRWNNHDVVALHQAPEFLKQAFILSEDKRFYAHGGADWLARGAAAVTNLRHMRTIRGASTITEQVVRMLNPRPRTLWSRWLEGWEAARLEARFGKDEILEFYFNQIPYAANRRGVRQAARYYFDRDLDTLSRKEMLALVVLVRAPSDLDLFRGTVAAEAAIARLAARLVEEGVLSHDELAELASQEFELRSTGLVVSAPHFLQYVRSRPTAMPVAGRKLLTTLDAGLQERVQGMLDNRLRALASRRVANGAVLAVDHATGEILAWAVGGNGRDGVPGGRIDAVTTPRQPGSALKPFLYALALERGWTAATLIDDSPLTEPVGAGLHSYQNYSRTFYGPVTLRQALGNSLNIPALRTLQHVGALAYLERLQTLGFAGLAAHPNVYGDGIALGNGEVTLYELVQAYAALANGGVLRPLTPFLHDPAPEPPNRVVSRDVAALIGNILSDRDARGIEFGRHSVLNLPVQTAIKTGTSSDYRDAWAVGYNDRYTVGVWLGNLDQAPTEGLTGSTGPALVLRGVFADLNEGRKTRPLSLSPRLVRRHICLPGVGEAEACVLLSEWFLPGTGPDAEMPAVGTVQPIRMRRPTHGLQIAYDPRLPPEAQAFEFFVQGLSSGDAVRWVIDGREEMRVGGSLLWRVVRGKHRVHATVWRQGRRIAELGEVGFIVK